MTANVMSGPPPSLRSKVIASLAWSAVRHWGARLIGLVTFVVLARFVQPNELGLVAAAMAVMAFVEIFAEQGLVSAIVQRASVTPALLNAAFALNIVVALVLATGVALGAPWIAAAMHVPEVTDVLRFVALTLVFGALAFCQEAMCQRNFEYRWLAVRTLTASVVAGAAAIALVVTGHAVWGLAAQAVLTSAVGAVLLWFRSQWKPSLEFDFAGLRSMLGYSVHMFGSRLLYYGNTRFIDLFLAATLGPALLGFYAVGMRVYNVLMQLLVSAVMEVAHSGFSRLAPERPRLLAAFYDATTVSAAVAVPLFLLTGVAAPEIVHVLFGARWLDSAVVMLPLALFGALQVLEWYAGSVVNAIGRPQLTLLINVAKLAATVVSLVATRGQPLAVVVWAYVGGQFLVAPLAFGLSRHAVGWSFGAYARRLAPFALGWAALFAAPALLRGVPGFDALPAFARLPLVVAAALGAHALVCLALARDELRRLRGLLKKR